MERTAKDSGKKASRRRFLGLGLAALGGLAVGDAFIWEPWAVEIRQVTLPSPKLPAGKVLRLVQLSDLHIRSHDDYLRRIAKLVNDLAPDLILLTGDYVEDRRQLEDFDRFLRSLKAKRGIFGVQGNWEHRAGVQGGPLEKVFRQSGGRLLNDRCQHLLWDKVGISLTGLDFPSRSSVLKNLQQQTDPKRLNLLLSHVPGFDHAQLQPAVDLVLCGHTHGGQVRLPFLSPLYMPRHTGDLVAGLYHVGPHRTPLYVSRGIGTSVIPVRFLCRPEITLLTLQG